MWEYISRRYNIIFYEAESVYNPIMLIHTDNHKKICQLYFQLDFLTITFWSFSHLGAVITQTIFNISQLLALTMLNALN